MRCTHAAAVAQVDPEQLYYLRSHGLGDAEAKRLVIEGFLAGAGRARRTRARSATTLATSSSSGSSGCSRRRSCRRAALGSEKHAQHDRLRSIQGRQLGDPAGRRVAGPGSRRLGRGGREPVRADHGPRGAAGAMSTRRRSPTGRSSPAGPGCAGSSAPRPTAGASSGGILRSDVIRANSLLRRLLDRPLPPRVAVVQRELDRFPAPRYLELGVHTGVLFLHVRASSKLGVDPDPRVPRPGSAPCIRTPRCAAASCAPPATSSSPASIRRPGSRSSSSTACTCTSSACATSTVARPPRRWRRRPGRRLQSGRSAERRARPRGDPGRRWSGDVWKAVAQLRAAPA